VKNPDTIVMTRIIDAPRSRVFEAWTRAEHLGKWYAPKGFTISDCAADPRPGGVFRMRWRAPWGGTFGIRGEYREVLPPVRLVIACTLEELPERVRETTGGPALVILGEVLRETVEANLSAQRQGKQRTANE